jgi:ribose transport system permease protein
MTLSSRSSEQRESPPETAPAPHDVAVGEPAPYAQRRVVLAAAARYGVLAAMVLTFVVFSVLRPDSFFTVLTLKGILRDCAPLVIAGLGITFVLVMNEFDVSLGGLVALNATIIILLTSTVHVGLPPALAVLLGVLIAAAFGLVNGVLIAYGGAPAFITTIATGTLFTGLSLFLTNSSTIFEGIPSSYVSIANTSVLGLSSQVWIALVLLVLAYVFLGHTTWGRYMYAVGGNPVTAELSGIRVRRLKALGFAVVGASAAAAAVMLTSQAGAANPNTGVGLLLPAYAAAFLGASMIRVGVFTPLGTALGAVFLQMIGTGLTILNLTGPVVQMIQGGILVSAILLARMVRR